MIGYLKEPGLCPLATVIANVATGFETGVDAHGAPSTRKDEVAALATEAQMLENMGQPGIGVELVYIAKALQDFEEKGGKEADALKVAFPSKAEGQH